MTKWPEMTLYLSGQSQMQTNGAYGQEDVQHWVAWLYLQVPPASHLVNLNAVWHGMVSWRGHPEISRTGLQVV